MVIKVKGIALARPNMLSSHVAYCLAFLVEMGKVLLCEVFTCLGIKSCNEKVFIDERNLAFNTGQTW